MRELVGSVMDMGLQVPLNVFETGGRYEVIAGHRRLLACRSAGVKLVKCIIDRGPESLRLPKMLAENTGREEVNPVEEARLYARLFQEQCDNDVDKLVALVKRPRARVEDRLILLAGDDQVLAAVHHRHISLAAARELNRIEDRLRRLEYLDAAIKSGATARTVAAWRAESAGLAPLEALPDGQTSDENQPQKIVPTNLFVCLFCGDQNDTHLMELLYLHRQCKRLVLRALNLETPQTA